MTNTSSDLQEAPLKFIRLAKFIAAAQQRDSLAARVFPRYFRAFYRTDTTVVLSGAEELMAR